MKIDDFYKERYLNVIGTALVLIAFFAWCGCGAISELARQGRVFEEMYKTIANLNVLASLAFLADMILLMKEKNKCIELIVAFGILSAISMTITVIYASKAIEAYGHWWIFI